MNLRQLIIGALLILFSFLLQAQEVEMADDFRGEGKIYVVVAVVITLIIGLFIQLMRLENKVKTLEKENEDQ